MIRFAVSAAFVFCASQPSTRAAHAQSEVLLRLTPEMGWVSAQHSRRVAAGSGWRERAAEASGPTFAATPSLGLRAGVLGNLLAGLEFEGVIGNRGTIGGDIESASNSEGEDGPDEWSLRDRFGVGVNVLLGVGSGGSSSQAYVFGGIRRMWTDFATGGATPDAGGAGAEGEWRARWPTTIGFGLTLRAGRLIDLRIGHSRGRTAWRAGLPDAPHDYEYATSRVTLSLGIGR